MKSRINTFFFILTCYLLVTTFFALKSPEGLKLVSFVTSISAGPEEVVNPNKSYSFVMEVVGEFYTVTKETTSFKKNLFLKESFSSEIYDDLKSDYLKLTDLLKEKKNFRQSEIEQILFDKKSGMHKVSLRLLLSDGEEIFVTLDIRVTEGKDIGGRLYVSTWKEVIHKERPENYKMKEVIVAKDVVSKMNFPCKTSLVSKAPPEGVEIRALNSGRLMELRFSENLLETANYSSQCKGRIFSTTFEPETKEVVTLFSRVRIEEGKFPRRKQTKEESIQEALEDW